MIRPACQAARRRLYRTRVGQSVAMKGPVGRGGTVASIHPQPGGGEQLWVATLGGSRMPQRRSVRKWTVAMWGHEVPFEEWEELLPPARGYRVTCEEPPEPDPPNGEEEQ